MSVWCHYMAMFHKRIHKCTCEIGVSITDKFCSSGQKYETYQEWWAYSPMQIAETWNNQDRWCYLNTTIIVKAIILMRKEIRVASRDLRHRKSCRDGSRSKHVCAASFHRVDFSAKSVEISMHGQTEMFPYTVWITHSFQTGALLRLINHFHT